MEIFMRNVPKHVAEIDVLIELAQRLHQAPFPIEPKINFDVDLFVNRYPGADKHRGMGILTLPTVELGHLFLNSYGQTGLNFKGECIRFTKDRNPRRNEGLMHKLRTLPWEDPDRLREQEEQLLEDSRPVPLKGFSFGCFCPDGAFSEERRCTADILRVVCDPVLKRLVVEASGSGPNGAFVNSAVFSAPQVAGISSGQQPRSPQVILEIDSLPIFTKTTNLYSDDPVITRKSAFGDELRIPYPCRHIRLTFSSADDYQLFLDRSRRLKLPRLVKRPIKVERRELYKPDVLSMLPGYFRSLNFDLGFEAEKNVLVGLILPSEIGGIIAEVVQSASRHELDPEAHAAPILRLFAFRLVVPGLRSNFQPNPNPPGWYRSHLRTIAKDYVDQLKRPLPLFSPTTSRRNARHLTITPASKILDGPMHGQSNSVLRRFRNHECFLRVSFEDEDKSKPKGGQDFDITELLERRYKHALLNGIIVAGRGFEFLGYSMSGLREYSFFFVYPFLDGGKLVDAGEIRDLLGDFSRLVHYPALLGARWAQAFSNTSPSIKLTPDQVVKINDRKSASGSCFTDGVGTISPPLLEKAWRKLKLERTDTPSSVPSIPSVIQIRLGGAKGVLSLDNTIPSDREIVCIRPSQQKFDTRMSLSLDIAGTSSHPLPMFLNRPLIVILEYLGVAPQTFLDLQRATVSTAHEVRTSMEKAARLFAQNGLGGPFELPSLFNLITKLFRVDVGKAASSSKIQHELIEDCLMYGSLHVLREIKHHSRIPVPGSYTLFGVADEYNCLEEGEIYAKVFDERRGTTKILTGLIAITRSPQVHPGDVQMVTAVDKSELGHIENAVVFSCKGNRSLPSCLGGGDLDGDIYNLILNPALHPRQTREPGSYESLPRKTTDHPCEVADVADFVIDYIKSDILGQIGILHLRFADYYDPGCTECLRLSEHYSHAVDYPKTGTPVLSSTLPKPPSKTKPDFLAGEGKEPTGKKYYPSPKALGTLFRDVEMDDPFPDRSDETRHPTDGKKISTLLKQLEPCLTNYPQTGVIEDMNHLLDAYINQLTIIAKANTLSRDSNDHLSEGELVSGTIMSTWGDHRKRKSAAEQMNNQMRELTNAVRREIKRRRTNLDGDLESSNDDKQSDSEDEDLDEDPIEGFRNSWAAWTVAENALAEDRNEFGPQSFGLIALGLMLRLSKKMQVEGYAFSRLPSFP